MHPESAAPPDIQATFCAALVDQWFLDGVRHAVVAPGSRSTPMAVAIAAHGGVELHMVHDERVAGFIALGLALDGIPALLLCTSGTAAANFFPAVVEAGLSAVPMIVLTADRPPELRGVGAPQTIDQIRLYGDHVRWFHDAEVAQASRARTWRPLARSAREFAIDGPVQLNLAFREPLLGTPLELPPPIEVFEPPSRQTARSNPVPTAVNVPRGLVLVGGRSGVAEADIVRLGAATGWPLIVDPMAAMRHLDGAITSAESLLRDSTFADSHLPDVVVRIGRPSTSKTLARWIDRAVADVGATLVQVGGPGRIDPAHNVTARCSIDAVAAACAVTAPDPDWSVSWRRADAAADGAISNLLAGLDAHGEMSEPGTARHVAASLPADVPLVVSSSMPVRDHEWFGGARAVAHANRGANGIDGVTSTALGLALDRGSAAVLIGDLAFVHDSNALAGLALRGTDLRIVVVDNDGGGIFSFLPQATELDPERFEQLFGTPHGTDVLMLARAHGITAIDIGGADQLVAQLARRGPWVARVASTRERNVEVHAALHAAVSAAI